MLKRVHRAYCRLYDWFTIVWRSKNEFEVPMSKKIKYALRGFSANESVWYDLEHNDYHQYISECERLRSRSINGIYKLILDDKMIFEEVFSRYARVPINYAWIENGHIHALHDYKISEETLFPFLIEVRKSVLKYLDRGGGAGTYIIDATENRLRVNGYPVSKETVRELFGRKDQSILCEYITQSEFAASLYPYTANTIRIICARKKGERAHVIGAVQRIGRQCSIPVDNFSSGGFVCEIDLETGELSDAVAGHGDIKERMKLYDLHPDTGGTIKGKKIPHWNELKCEMENLTNRLPYLNFVAWDILLTEPEEDVNSYCIIEGNASSGCVMLQIKRQGCKDRELGDIYRSYRIID